MPLRPRPTSQKTNAGGFSVISTPLYPAQVLIFFLFPPPSTPLRHRPTSQKTSPVGARKIWCLSTVPKGGASFKFFRQQGVAFLSEAGAALTFCYFCVNRALRELARSLKNHTFLATKRINQKEPTPPTPTCYNP